MKAYEFYCSDLTGMSQVIGILPERRKKPERITAESVMNWGARIFGKKSDAKDIFYIQVTMDLNTGRIFRPIRNLSNLKK